MKIKRILLSNICGYSSLAWDHIQPDVNFLLGRNGAGKTTILQCISLALNFVSGRRSEDLLTRTYPEAEIELEMTEMKGPVHYSFAEVRRSQSPPKTGYTFNVLQFVENRQPKNTVGDVRNELRQHAMNRYPNAVSEVKHLLSSSAADRNLAAEVMETCKKISATGNLRDWQWIEREINDRSSTKARPLSCGQFDMLALSLDLVRMKRSSKDGAVFVLLDNPETFLHPACQEPVIELILEEIPQAQLFIASHSLKLLCHRKPKSVFWLRRESQDGTAAVQVKCIRDLEDGAKSLFYELYGDDVSSAVLSLLHSFESPEYYKYLAECALSSEPVLRAKPSRDRQMMALRHHIVGGTDRLTILDYGAGNGDLLAALLEWGDADRNISYVAVNIEPSPILMQRLDEAKEKGKVSQDSKTIRDLSDAPRACDVIVLCNVCHEISLPDLPVLMAKLITRHLKRSGTAKILIHEADTLPVGEANFIMWTPEDLRAIYNPIDGMRVDTNTLTLPGSIPLDTTMISFSRDPGSLSDLQVVLIERFFARLPKKKEEILCEIASLQKVRSEGSGLREAFRQRRLAFLTAQFAAIGLIDGRRLL